MKRAGRLIDNPHAFDWVVATFSAVLVFGAYFTAYAYVARPGELIQPAGTIGQGTALAAWLALVAILFGAFAWGLRGGRSWDHALPDGYVGSLAAALAFAVAWLVDAQYWSRLPFEQHALGLDALFTPPRLVEIAAAAVIVSGPLRAAARRGESDAGFVTLLSASLLLSVVTFATQFMHPLIDPWSYVNYESLDKISIAWIGENEGVAAILAQALILAGAALLLNSGFRLRTGSLTLVFTLNGILVLMTKQHFEFLPVVIATGLAGDAWLWRTSRRPGRPSASLCAIVGTGFAVSYMIEIEILGTVWTLSLWLGTILATAMMCWLTGRLLRAGLPTLIVASVTSPLVAPSPPPAAGLLPEPRWPRDPENTVRPLLVRAALDDLGTPEALARSPLGKLPGISRGGGAAADVRAALIDVIIEIAGSSQPRDAEAGKLLNDYYVKKIGSHEVIMERLHLSRPTYYRRLQRGFQLVAERLDEMAEFAGNVPLTP